MSTGEKRSHVIVLGNEKGGSGKSTTAVHIAIALAHAGFRIAMLDLDARQRTVDRYMENRAAFAGKRGLTLPMVDVGVIADTPEGEAELDALPRCRIGPRFSGHRHAGPQFATGPRCAGPRRHHHHADQ